MAQGETVIGSSDKTRRNSREVRARSGIASRLDGIRQTLRDRYGLSEVEIQERVGRLARQLAQSEPAPGGRHGTREQGVKAMSQQNPDKRNKDDVQGEGDYRSARKYNKDTREYMEKHDYEKDAEAARPESEQEAAELEKARERASAEAEERDPEEKRDYSKPTK